MSQTAPECSSRVNKRTIKKKRLKLYTPTAISEIRIIRYSPERKGVEREQEKPEAKGEAVKEEETETQEG